MRGNRDELRSLDYVTSYIVKKIKPGRKNSQAQGKINARAREAHARALLLPRRRRIKSRRGRRRGNRK